MQNSIFLQVYMIFYKIHEQKFVYSIFFFFFHFNISDENCSFSVKDA